MGKTVVTDATSYELPGDVADLAKKELKLRLRLHSNQSRPGIGRYRILTPGIAEESFLEVRNWFLEHNIVFTRNGTLKQPNYYFSPIERVELNTAFHVTCRDAWNVIQDVGLDIGRVETYDGMHLDSIGNLYVSEHLGTPKDFESGNKGTAHWWSKELRYHRKKEYPIILKVNLTSIPPVKCYRDPWSDHGVVLNMISPIQRSSLDLVWLDDDIKGELSQVETED